VEEIEWNSLEMTNPEANNLQLQCRSGKKTVVIGHSKGGLDTLQALAKHTELSRMVRMSDQHSINSWSHNMHRCSIHGSEDEAFSFWWPSILSQPLLH